MILVAFISFYRDKPGSPQLASEFILVCSARLGSARLVVFGFEFLNVGLNQIYTYT